MFSPLHSVVVTGLTTIALTQPLLVAVADSVDRFIKRSLTFELATLEPRFVDHYQELRKGKVSSQEGPGNLVERLSTEYPSSMYL
jgi:hypothetical protein